MDSSIYIFGVFATPALTFTAFWLLETIKSARQNKQANLRAIRSIAFEVYGVAELVKNEQVYKSMWLVGLPMSFKSNIWERFGGEIIVSNEDRDSIEWVYVCIILLNNNAKFLSEIKSNHPADEQRKEKLESIYNETMVKPLNDLRNSINKANDILQKNIGALEKETDLITVLKEFFGPSHRIVRIFQDFPNKSSSNKE
jgi:hypothetical protein